MFSQLAQVFSSQGVVLQGAEFLPEYQKEAAPEAPCDHKGNCSCFSPKFEQASAKLELSKQAITHAKASEPGHAYDKPLSEEAQKQVKELAKGDREVKAHEASHKASAGGNARGASYEYQTGPDGKRYAVGGHVDIDVSPVQGNPRATVQKARIAQRAALAPAEPSGQDRAVAAAAAQMAREAQSEVAEDPSKASSGGEAAAPGLDARRAYAQQTSRKGASLNVYA